MLSYVFMYAFAFRSFSLQANTAIIGRKTRPMRKSSDNDIF